MIEAFIERASSYAGDIDNLILLIAVIVFGWLLAAEAVFFFFILRFRAKDGQPAEYIDGSNKKHKRWITIPHMLVLAFDVLIIIAAVRVWVDVKQTMPEPDLTVRVVGQQWSWTFQHPGLDGKLDTDDDVMVADELHLLVHKTYHFELLSRDVLHDFSIPAFRLKQDAVPGRMIKGWFRPTKTGTHDIQCAEMCGIGHGIMFGRAVIETSEEHEAWLAKNAALKPAALSPFEGMPAPAKAAAPAAPAEPSPAAAPAVGDDEGEDHEAAEADDEDAAAEAAAPAEAPAAEANAENAP
jgi:cytochrome c oxidase subunit 2